MPARGDSSTQQSQTSNKSLTETQKFFLRDVMSLGVMSTKEVKVSYQRAHEKCEPESNPMSNSLVFLKQLMTSL